MCIWYLNRNLGSNSVCHMPWPMCRESAANVIIFMPNFSLICLHHKFLQLTFLICSVALWKDLRVYLPCSLTEKNMLIGKLLANLGYQIWLNYKHLSIVFTWHSLVLERAESIAAGFAIEMQSCCPLVRLSDVVLHLWHAHQLCKE